MKRSLLTRTLKAGILSVPAAAMMLGAANGAQMGFNLQAWYYNSGTTPQTVGFGAGYQTTGFPVTSNAFGVALADWTNTDPLSCGENGFGVPIDVNIPWGSLNVHVSAGNMWQSGIGGLEAGWVPQTVSAGNDEATWGYCDDTAGGYYVTISGLRGIASDYKIQTIAAIGASKPGFPDVELTTMGTNVQALNYTNTGGYYEVYSASGSGTVGTSSVSTAYVTLSGNDSVTLHGLPRGGPSDLRSTLAAIILTYTPGVNAPLVETEPQAPTEVIFPGDSFELSSLASGTSALVYQWRQNGTDIPGATFATYTNTSAVVGDTGDYDVVVTNAYGAVTSAVAQVTITPVTPPVIGQAPVSQSLYEGYPATFSVAATGGQLSYQWKSNAVAIAGATGTSYTIASITPEDAGTYTVDVSNSVGPTASASATLTVNVPTGDYETAVVATKPSLWFRYSETAAPPVDTAGNSGSLGSAGDGVYIGNATHPVAGALVGSSDGAAELSGGKVSVPYNAALNPAGAFSVDAWIKPAGSGTGCIMQEMINGENPGLTTDRSGWALRQNGTGLRFLVGDLYGAPFYYYYTTADGLITPGVWQHVAVVYNDVAPSIYINGVLAPTTVTRQDNVAMTQPEIDALRIIPNNAAPLIVGDRGYGGWSFAGSVDEVALYPSALTSGQVLAHYQNGTNATPSPAYDTLVTGDGAVEYLRLDEAALPSPLVNSGTLGAAFDGTYGGDITPNTVGPRPPTQPGFEADNIAVGMTNGFATSPMLPLNTDTVTVTCWLKRQDPSTTGDLSWPAWLGDGGMHMNADGELRHHWKGGKWGWGSELFVPANVWTFCAMVVDPDKATFYMSDGDTLLTSVDPSSHGALVVSSPPGFGGNQPGRADRNYIGQIDETTVYDRALSQSEITTLFLVGTGAPFQLGIVPGGIIEDTNPSSPLHNGENLGTTWLASSTDGAKTRNGVEVFTATNATQIVTPGAPEFNATVGTFAFWMRTAAVPLPGSGNEAAMFMDRRSSAGTVIAMGIGGEVFVQCSGGANTLSDASYLPDGFWHLVAVTYDQSVSGSIEIYVDGVLSASQPNSAAWSWPATQPIELGRSHDGYWYRYDGEMDDFRFYDRILTPAEISAIYTSDALVDAGALKLRYNFDTAGIGYTVTYPFGTLESTPTLNPPDWQPVPGATPPNYPTSATDPAQFFRAIP